jgi:26S proteasome regulatory subunit N12
MSNSNNNIPKLLNDLESLVTAGTDLVAAKETLTQLKIAMFCLTEAVPKAQHVAALELGVLLSVTDNDLDAFACNMAQLEPLYDLNTTTTTPRQALVVGLNLMYLLVQFRLAEFHSQLELLTADQSQNPLIAFPIALEQKLMVGNYDDTAADTVPHPSFQLFLDPLLATIRSNLVEMMNCYETVTLADAAKICKFASPHELQEWMMAQTDDDAANWTVNEQGNLVFATTPQADDVATGFTTKDADGSTGIPSMQWIEQSLTYATEMERII